MRKVCLVYDGHNTDALDSIIYSCVVSRYSVSIAFLISSLNCLGICSCGTNNNCLNPNCREKLWMVVVTEFGPSNRGSIMIIDRVLYGLKYSGLA